MSIDLRNAPPWLFAMQLAEDDTEESVMGSDLHQAAILELYAALLEYAEALGGAEGPAWYVSSQVTVIVPVPGLKRPWQPKPDLFVVPGVPVHSRTSYDSRTEGPMPPFVLEVASESTWRRDVEEKAKFYSTAGVLEYLIFDPTGAWLGEPVRAWRREEERWEPWPPERRADGQPVWHSAVLGLALRPEGLLLRADHPERGVLPTRRELREYVTAELAALRIAEEQASREAAARRIAEEQASREAAARRAAEEQVSREVAARRELEEQAAREVAARRELEERAARLEEQLRAARLELERLRISSDE